MLQALARERRAPGRAADQEAARLHVAASPDEVADALETEHRVIDIERHHRHVMIRVRRARRNPGTKRAGLVDALFENLALLVLAVIHQLARILRLVQLAFRRINTNLAEHALHTEGARLVRHDGHDVLADLLVSRQRGKHANERHCRRCLALTGAVKLRLECLQRRHWQRLGLRTAARQEAAQSLAGAPSGTRIPALSGFRLVVRHLVADLIVADRNIEAITERLESLRYPSSSADARCSGLHRPRPCRSP